MKKPQWIVVAAGVVLVAGIYQFGSIVPPKKTIVPESQVHSADDGHDHSAEDGHDHGIASTITSDTILNMSRKQLTPEQVMRLNMLENSISRGDVKAQQLKVFRDLSRFWSDSARIFEPYAWYMAEAARLENSEKTLTFAAHLFLENLQQNRNPHLNQWKAMQAKDLFERSLKINPDNDSARVGLGACYLFGNISAAPMEGINMIREVIAKDSTNMYAQLTLAKGSLISKQYDKAITRLESINRMQPGNAEAMLMLADVYMMSGDNKSAIDWYAKSLPYLERADAKAAVEERISELKK